MQEMDCNFPNTKPLTSELRLGRLFQKYVAGYIPPGIRRMMEPPTTKHFRWWGNRGIWIGHSCEVVLERGFGFDENILLCCSEVHSSHNWFSEKPHKLRLALPDMKSQGFSCFAVTKQHLMKQHLSSSNRWVVDDINDIHPRYYTKHPSGQSLISVTDKSLQGEWSIGSFCLDGPLCWGPPRMGRIPVRFLEWNLGGWWEDVGTSRNFWTLPTL